MEQNDIKAIAVNANSISNAYGATAEEYSDSIVQAEMNSGIGINISEVLSAMSQKCFVGALDENGRHYRFTKE